MQGGVMSKLIGFMLLICAIMLPHTCGAANLLSNPGFEDGAGFVNGWFSWGDCSVADWAARTGVNGAALHAWNIGSYGGFGQDVPVVSHVAGDIFTFSMDALPEPYFGSSSGHVSLNIDCLAGEVITTSFVVNVYAALDSHRGTWITLAAAYTNFDATINTVRVTVVAADFSPLGEGPMACMWDNASFEVVDLAQPRLILSGDATIHTGCSNEWSVQRNSVGADDLTVTVTSSSPTIVSAPSDVTILAGTTSVTFFVTGLTTGEANVLVSADGWQSAQIAANVALQSLVLTGNEYFHVGDTNTWTVTRYGSQTATAIVNLSNGSPSVVSAPSQVVIAAGSSSTSFAVAGQAIGTGTLIADSENFQAGSRDFAVVARTLSFVWPGTLYAAVTNECTVTRHDTLSGNLVIGLSNDAPGVVDVPSSVTIDDGESNATFLVAGLTAGSASLWASAPGYESTGTLVVVAANRLSLGGGTVVPLAGSNLWTIAREGPLHDSLDVALTVDDTDVMEVPPSVTIGALSTSASFYVSGRGAWTGTVTASAADYPSATKSATVSRSILQNSGFEDGPGFINGWFSWGSCSVEAWATHTGERGVALHGWIEGAYGGFAQDVAVTSHAEGDVYTFSIEGMAEPGFGSTTETVAIRMEFLQGETIRSSCETNIYAALTSSRDTWNRHTLIWTNADVLVDTVRVLLHAADYGPTGFLVAAMWDNADLSLDIGSESNLSIQGNTTLYEGGSSTFTVRRSGAIADSLTVTLGMLNTNVASIAASVIIPAGTNAATFQVTGVSLGTTAIKASATGYPSRWQPIAVCERTLLLDGPSPLYTASTSQWTVARVGPVDASLDITLSSSRPTVASVPESITLSVGVTSTTFSITGVATGSATITATAPGLASASRSVAVSQRVLTLSGVTSLHVGLSNEWTITRQGSTAESLLVTLSNDAPSVASAPDAITIESGNSSAMFHISGVQQGTAHLAAAASGYLPADRSLAVSPNGLTLGGLRTVAAGQSNRWVVTRTGPLSSPVTVDLSIDQPTIADAPKDVTIPAGTNTVSFFVQGLTFGAATVTATAPDLLPSELSIDVTDNLLRNPGFEEDVSWGDAWSSWGSISVEAWAAETGDRGVAMHGWNPGGYGGCMQNVAITTSAHGDVYVFSLNGRSDPDFWSSSGTLALLLQFWDAEMQLVSAVTNVIFEDFAAQAESWNTYVVSAINTYTDVHFVSAAIHVSDYAPTGGLSAAMWDNASLQKHALIGSNLLLIGRNTGYEGTSNRWLVTRIGPCDDSLTVTFSSDESSIATVDNTVVIPAGAASAPVTIVLQTNQSPTFKRYDGDPLASTATITAQADGYPPTNKDIIAQGNVLMLSGQASIYVSLSNRWTVTRSGPIATLISVTLNSDQPTVASVPASVDIGAGNASADFYVTGHDAGSATITAATDGYVSTSRLVAVTNIAPDIATGSAENATLLWMGTAGCRYLVEESLHLGGPWTQVRNIHCSQSGVLQWQDANFASATSKYYRILMLITNAPDSAYGN